MATKSYKITKSKIIRVVDLETENEQIVEEKQSVDMIEFGDEPGGSSNEEVLKNGLSLSGNKTEIKEENEIMEIGYEPGNCDEPELKGVEIKRMFKLEEGEPGEVHDSCDDSDGENSVSSSDTLPWTDDIDLISELDCNMLKSEKVSIQSTSDIFLKNTQSFPKPLLNLLSSPRTIFLDKTQNLPERIPNETPQTSPDLCLLESTENDTDSFNVFKTSTPIKNLQIESGGRLNVIENWPQVSPILEDFNEKSISDSVPIRPCFIRIQKIQPRKVMSKSIREMSLNSHKKAPMPSPFAEIPPLSSTGVISSDVSNAEEQNRFSSCPMCFKFWMLPDLEVHAAGCEWVEEGFIGMATGFLCGYCILHIKEKEEDAEGHLIECKAEQFKKRVKEGVMKRKKTLRGGPVVKSKFCKKIIDEEKLKNGAIIKIDKRQPSTSKRNMNAANCKPSTSFTSERSCKKATPVIQSIASAPLQSLASDEEPDQENFPKEMQTIKIKQKRTKEPIQRGRKKQAKRLRKQTPSENPPRIIFSSKRSTPALLAKAAINMKQCRVLVDKLQTPAVPKCEALQLISGVLSSVIPH